MRRVVSHAAVRHRHHFVTRHHGHCRTGPDAKNLPTYNIHTLKCRRHPDKGE
jgi:hypothetical protein